MCILLNRADMIKSRMNVLQSLAEVFPRLKPEFESIQQQLLVNDFEERVKDSTEVDINIFDQILSDNSFLEDDFLSSVLANSE
jgi:hypothetical protein